MANRKAGSTRQGGRATRDERREQARRERAELQRKIAKARRNRRIGILLVVALAAGLGVYAFTRPQPVSADPTQLLASAAEEARAAGCAPPENVGPYQPESRDQAHVNTEAAPPLSTYPSVPPASGPHNHITLARGIYTTAPPIDRLLHSLEHGAVVVWYRPSATGPELDRIFDFYDDDAAGSRVIVAPFDYPDQAGGGQLPAGVDMSLVAWHFVETCRDVNLAAAFDFSSQYAAPPFGERPYLGEAPEAGSPF